MKVMTAREAERHFGECLDAAQHEPVVITENNQPVGMMISMQDAADSLLSERLLDKEPGHDAWMLGKVTRTLENLDSGASRVTEHQDAMQLLRARLQARLSNGNPLNAAGGDGNMARVER